MVKPKCCTKCKRPFPPPIPKMRSPVQKKVLAYIGEYISRAGMAPTYEEIANKFRITKVTVWEHLHNMKKTGLITLKKHKRRSIQILAKQLHQFQAAW